MPAFSRRPNPQDPPSRDSHRAGEMVVAEGEQNLRASHAFQAPPPLPLTFTIQTQRLHAEHRFRQSGHRDLPALPWYPGPAAPRIQVQANGRHGAAATQVTVATVSQEQRILRR
jgi:hypothetical protein